MATETVPIQRSDATLDAAFLRCMFQGSVVPLLACAADGTILAANPAAEKLLTPGHQITPGLAVSEVFPMEVRERVQASLQDCKRTQAPVDFELSIQEGSNFRLIRISLTPVIERDAQLRGVAFAFREITAQRERAELESKEARLRALGGLAGSVAHHYNNMLGCLATAIDYANNMTTLSAAKKALQRTSEPLKRGATIAQQLLAFAEADHRYREKADLTSVVREFCSERESAWRDRGISLEVDIDAAGEWLVPRDAMRLILQHLTDNSLDAQPHGGKLRVELHNADGETALLAVTDAGPGIDRRIMSRVFEPFQTTKGELSTCGPGYGRNVGLGLAVVHGLVRAMGGRVSASNPPEGGARFELLIPRPS
jgi:two-component system cell cycle sensor histidine kinase/response regulator CckA